MVQALIKMNEREDRILNIVKAQHGLKNKSQAIELVLNVYADSFLEPQVRPEYVKKLKKISKGKHIKFNSFEELEKRYK